MQVRGIFFTYVMQVRGKNCLPLTVMQVRGKKSTLCKLEVFFYLMQVRGKSFLLMLCKLEVKTLPYAS